MISLLHIIAYYIYTHIIFGIFNSTAQPWRTEDDGSASGRRGSGQGDVSFCFAGSQFEPPVGYIGFRV